MNKENLYDAVGKLAFEYSLQSSIEGDKAIIQQIIDLCQPEWTYISTDDKHSLINLPKHEQEILFKFGVDVHAGIFLDDIVFGQDGDFGFYDNGDHYYEAENVSCWTPLNKPPTTATLSDSAPKVG